MVRRFAFVASGLVAGCGLVTGLSGYEIVDEVAEAGARVEAGPAIETGPPLDSAPPPRDAGPGPDGAPDPVDARADADSDVPPIDQPCLGVLHCVRYVFVTSERYQSHRALPVEADRTCTEAAARGVAAPVLRNRRFRAWTSTAASPAGERLPHGTAAYRRIDGVVVATSWTDLADGSLRAPIHLQEEGQPISNENAVWTGTNPDGTAGAFSCDGWTEESAAEPALVGLATENGESWTRFPSPMSCGVRARLYCFED